METITWNPIKKAGGNIPASLGNAMNPMDLMAGGLPGITGGDAMAHSYAGPSGIWGGTMSSPFQVVGQGGRASLENSPDTSGAYGAGGIVPPGYAVAGMQSGLSLDPWSIALIGGIALVVVAAWKR